MRIVFNLILMYCILLIFDLMVDSFFFQIIMTNLTKSHLLSIVGQDTANIFQKFNDFNKIISNESDEHIKYLRNLLSNIPQPGSSLNNRSMSTKTRKVQKIQPIPENETVNYDREDFSVSSVDTNNEDKENTIAANRPRRKTSKRQNNIDEFEHFVPPLMVTNNEDKDNTIAANRPGKKTSKRQNSSDEFEPPPSAKKVSINLDPLQEIILFSIKLLKLQF